MAYRFLSVRTEDRVGWLEFNRPPINAFHREMVEEVGAALDALLADPAVRVIVLASALERLFSAGAELQLFRAMTPGGMRDWVGLVHGLAGKMRSARKPLLAAIHGSAVGGGLEMTLHCDVRFCAADARLGQPEIAIGFIPPVATTQALVRLIGRPRALRYLYEGTLVSAQEALAMGLVDVLVEPARLRAEVQAYAAALATKPAEALAAIRRCLTRGEELAWEAGLAIEAEEVVRLVSTPDFAEGVRAFLEKRAPRFD
jgi:enoyl-CoA hydratase/carnithine racemase